MRSSATTFRLSLVSSAKFALAAFLATAGVASFYMDSASAEDPVVLAPAAPQVEVATLQGSQIRTWSEFSGRITPVQSAQIKPLVSGTIQQVLFTEGERVKQGSPLFVIDPRPHQAALLSAQARLATAQSRVQLAEDEFKRAGQLLASKVLSQSLYDAAVSSLQVAQAAVMEAEGALSQAQLNLEYAHISAPISGRVSRAELTLGNVVEAGANAPVLTTIVADESFYVEFNVSESLYIQLVRNSHNPQAMPVELTLGENTGVTYQGHIHAFDNHLDTASGTIRARALVDNADGVLAAGMYANVRLGAAQLSEVLLVPERAIGTNQSHKFVYVIDAENVAQYREISLGEQYQGQRIVVDGIAAGEQIVINGLSHISPNSKVDPVVVVPVTVAAK